MLDGIVLLLLSLADLAERAATAPRFVRLIVLLALRQADFVAKEFVTGPACDTTGRRWSPAIMQIHYGDDPVDAMRLALSLRLLARAVRCIVLHTPNDPVRRMGWSMGGIGGEVRLDQSVDGTVQSLVRASDARIDSS